MNHRDEQEGKQRQPDEAEYDAPSPDYRPGHVSDRSS